MSTLRAYVALARPAQWIKNGFVLVGLLFGHGWRDPVLLQDSLACFLGFCLVSSAVYAFNDIMDREADRAHPEKQRRPLASGAISMGAAIIFAVLLGGAGMTLAATASPIAMALISGYLALNLGYSLGLKHVVVLDVFIIAAGFMLRILVGTLGVGIAPSGWLLFCGFMLTLFLGFAKRRSELSAFREVMRLRALDLPGQAPNGAPADPPTRKVLAVYQLGWLDRIIGVSALVVVVAYALYTLDEGTIALHGTDRLFWTVPWVVYGVGRYLWVLYRHGRGEDPTTQLWRDPHLLASLAGWLAMTWWLIT